MKKKQVFKHSVFEGIPDLMITAGVGLFFSAAIIYLPAMLLDSFLFLAVAFGIVLLVAAAYTLPKKY